MRGNFPYRPDGRIDLKVEVPKEPMIWVVNAFSVSREKGLGVMHKPARVTTHIFHISFLFNV